MPRFQGAFRAHEYDAPMHQCRAALILLLALSLALAVVACGPAPTPAPSTPPSASPTATGNESPSSSPSPTTSDGSPLPPEAWTLVATDGPAPSPRMGHSWTADPSAGVAYLFGGSTASGPVAELWVYDLGADSWTQTPLDGPGPGARSGHAAGWLDGVGLLIVGGRDAEDRPLDDAWTFDPGTSRWSRVPAGSSLPPGRSDACGVVDPTNAFWLSHGRATDPLADTWRFDPAARTWLAASPDGEAPDPRSGAVCWWTPGLSLAIAGGSGGAGVVGDGWSLDEPGTTSAEWTRLPVDLTTAARSGAASARHDDAMVLVGGLAPSGGIVADVVRIELESMAVTTYATPAGGPGPRQGGAMVDDPASERLLMFGGSASEDAADANGEVWQLTLP